MENKKDAAVSFVFIAVFLWVDGGVEIRSGGVVVRIQIVVVGSEIVVVRTQTVGVEKIEVMGFDEKQFAAVNCFLFCLEFDCGVMKMVEVMYKNQEWL